MKLKPFSFIYIFRNSNYIHQSYRYCFVGDVEQNIKDLLDKYQYYTQQDAFDTISDVNKKKLESLYGEHWISLLFPKKLEKQVMAGGQKSGLGNVLSILNEVKMKKADTDAIYLEPNNKLTPSKYPLKNIFIYNTPPMDDDNVTLLQQKIQRYIRYSDNEFAILEPDYQYLWLERKGFIEKKEESVFQLAIGLSHRCITSYDTTDFSIKPDEKPVAFNNIEKVEFLGDSLVEYLYNSLTDQIYMVDYWNEVKGLNIINETNSYLKYLFPKVSSELYHNPVALPNAYSPSYLTLVNELKYKDSVMNLILEESESKMYKKINSLSGYRITQCIFKGQTYNKINQQLFLDKLHMNKKFVFAKWTTSSKMYWGKVYAGFLDQIKTVQNWKSQNNLLRSIVIKLKLDISGDDSKYVTLTFRTMEDERTELSIKMNFKAHMNVTLDIINNEYLPYVITCVRELEKMCDFVILDKEFSESLSVYNITTEINVFLPNKSEIANNKKNRIISKLSSHFQPYSATEPNSILYIKTHNYLIEKKERINSYLRSNILEYGSNPPSNVITTISNVLKMPVDQVQLMYANVVKMVKTNTPNVTKSLEYKPNGIKIKNLFDAVKNNNTFYLMGITSEKEFYRLYDLIIILSTIYYRYYVTKEDPDLTKRLQSLSKELNLLGTKEEFDSDERDKKQQVPKSVKRIKKLTLADPERNGYKPPKGTPGYSRLCQHQPDVVDEDEAKEYLGQKGFQWNEKIGGYEKDEKGEKIFAISLVSSHDNKKKFYYCDDPEYKHIGVTDPSKHPKKMVTACCFKLNQFNKADPVKKELFKTHSGLLIENMGDEEEVVDENFKKSYVYKDKPFVNIDRIGMLEKNLDIFLNRMQTENTMRLTTDERLEETDGYFLKQGIDLKYEISPLIQVLLQITDLTLNEFKKRVFKSLPKIFRWLMDGNIALHYESPEQLQEELERTDALWKSNDFVLSIIACPGVFLEKGANIALFSNGFVDDQTIFFDRNNFKINYIPTNNFNDMDRELIMLINDQTTAKQFVYPICRVTKKTGENSFEVQNIFLTKEIPHLKDLYEKTFSHLTKSIGDTSILPRDAITILNSVPNFEVIGQVLNVYNKVSHLVLKIEKGQRFLIPVSSKFGYMYDLNVFDAFTLPLDDYLSFITSLNEKVKESLQLIPKSLTVNNRNGKQILESLKFDSNLTVPLDRQDLKDVKPELPVTEKDFSLEELDKEILNRKKNEPYLDKMIRDTNTKNYVMINYQYYRLHWFKYFTMNKEGKKHAKYLIDFLNNTPSKEAFKQILLYMDKLYDDLDFDEKNKKDIIMESHLSSIKYCPVLSKNNCTTNEHCFWNDKNGQCRFQMNKEYKDHFLQRLVSEICMPGIYRDEIFGLNNNSVSEFWGENFKFEERKNELLFSSITDSNYNFEYFVSNNLDSNQSFQHSSFLTLKDNSSLIEEKSNNEVKITNTHYIQSILHDSLNIFRLLANVYYYTQNPLLPSSQRILLNGSESQSKLAIEIRGLVFMKLFEINPDVKEDKLIPFISGMYNENNQVLLTLENIFTIIRCYSLLNEETINKQIIIYDTTDTYYFMNGKRRTTVNEKAEKIEFKIIKSNDLVTRFDAMFSNNSNSGY